VRPLPRRIRQRRNVGNLDLAPIMFIIPLHFEIPSCDKYLASGRTFRALSLNDELRHIGEHHPRQSVTFQCVQCGRTYAKEGALCHLPKRPATEQGVTHVPVVGQVTYAECRGSYNTERGLAQHESFAHPVARNESRAAAGAPRPREPKRVVTDFTEEEIELLHLDVQLFGTGTIVQQM
jgi:hypothetical protein